MLRTYKTPAAYFAEIAQACPQNPARITRNEIAIRPEGVSGLPVFKAVRHSADIASFAIRSLEGDDSRHPLFEQYKVSEMAQQAIEYFDQQAPLDGVAFNWWQPASPVGVASNYNRYYKSKELFSGLSEERARIAAAFTTWTLQKVLMPTGFNYIHTVYEQQEVAAKKVCGIVWRAL